MKIIALGPLLLAVGTFPIAAALLAKSGDTPSSNDPRVPVVVELFTSEGCSSCPPADNLLQKLDAQPVAGAEIIVLSEHVDYWNSIGWTDPYSSHDYSERQDAYGRRFHLQSVYTPQMVVDGAKEFLGSDSGDANKAISKAATSPKVSVRLSGATLQGNVLRAHIDTATAASGEKADVFLVVALNRAESQVTKGENAGHRLSHVAVVRSISQAGKVESGQTFSQDVSVKLDSGITSSNLRVIGFVQEPGQGRILGAAMQKLAQ
jgi:hypothetical protein